ncbi:MAG: hypothetical protein K8R34_18375 [Methanosarcinales archaeon]|nr:hypothetical protein [Methanosarcinales archaeon]
MIGNENEIDELLSILEAVLDVSGNDIPLFGEIPTKTVGFFTQSSPLTSETTIVKIAESPASI